MPQVISTLVNLHLVLGTCRYIKALPTPDLGAIRVGGICPRLNTESSKHWGVQVYTV